MKLQMFDTQVREALQCCNNIKRIETSIACEGYCTAKVVLQCGRIYWVDEFDLHFLNLIIHNIQGHAS